MKSAGGHGHTIAKDDRILFGPDPAGRRRRLLATALQKVARDEPISLIELRKRHPDIKSGTLNWDMHILAERGYAREMPTPNRGLAYQAIMKALPASLSPSTTRIVFDKAGHRRPTYPATAKLLAALQQEKEPVPVRSLRAATGMRMGEFHGHIDMLRELGYATIHGKRGLARYSSTNTGRGVLVQEILQNA